MLLYGKPVAEKIEEQVRVRVERFRRLTKRSPVLDIILTSDDAASALYVKKKQEACSRVGIECRVYQPLELADVYQKLRDIKDAGYCHGVILQLPLPQHMRSHTKSLFKLICEERDVDVFNPVNVGLLVQGQPRFLPCTPHAIQAILQHYNMPVAHRHVVIINRSDVVGKPLSSMLIQDNGEYSNATVTVCHDHTPTNDLRRIASSADILVVAVGIPDFVKGDLVSSQTVLIDVGINRVDGRVVGDASPEAVGKVRAYTPVPGGVGPVTVAMILHNTVTAAEKLYGNPFLQQEVNP